MKGWIKAHRANKTWQDRYLRAQDIYAIEEYTEDEKEGYKPFSCTLINDCYNVSESPEEVLALIEKAEKPWYVKAKEECEKRVNGCVGCPLMSICNETPRTWVLDSIPEEYR